MSPASPPVPPVKKSRVMYGILGASTLIAFLWMIAALRDVTQGRIAGETVYLWTALMGFATAWALGFGGATALRLLYRSPADPRETRWKTAGAPIAMGLVCLFTGVALGSCTALNFMMGVVIQAEGEWIGDYPFVTNPQMFRADEREVSPWFTADGHVRPEKRESWCVQMDTMMTNYAESGQRRMYGDVHGSLWVASAGAAVLWREGCVSDAEFLARSQGFNKAMAAARKPVSLLVLERQRYNPLYWGTLSYLRKPQFDRFGNTPFKACHAALHRYGPVAADAIGPACSEWAQDRLVTAEDLEAFHALAARLGSKSAPAAAP